MDEFTQPIMMTWDGESLVPQSRRWAAVCDKQLVVGQTYRVAEVKDRSVASHNHFFACLAEAHANLPEVMAERLQTSEHLRKYCLIRAGFRDERSIVAGSKAEAKRLAAFIRPMDDFAFVTVSEATVTVWTAKSQSMRAMGKDEFNRSKQAVLDMCADFIGVAPDALASNAGRAA